MNSSTTAAPVDQTNRIGIPWQTIFWTLVPLAISSMSQPGGRISGLPSRYRTYLRCSPVLCAADTLSIFTNLTTLCFYQKYSFTEAVAITLQARLNNDLQEEATEMDVIDEYNEIEGIQSLENMTWLRWLWFILGTLPPAIKFLAMGGILWEQAWGLMFLTSWTINEGLMIFASMNQSFFTISNTGRISWPGYEQARLSPDLTVIRNVLAKVDISLATIALTVHTVILNGALRIVYRTLRSRTIPQAELQIQPDGQQYPTTTSASYVSIISTATVACISLSIAVSRRMRLQITGIVYLLFFTTFIMLFNTSTNTIMFAWQVLNAAAYGDRLRSSIYVYILSTTSMIASMLFTQYLGRRFEALGNSLLITRSERTEDGVKVDVVACFAFVFFLATILTCLLWYGFIYDSSGTSSPSWTGVFG
ncbi:hypothetical protein BKA64DRAFT_707818 [Cadophora sp. MPI-SDFR-AT-0126]|nr:hypothetical protein BKA64DRAFT_707818 [Leotiomycetes sp. MPI-SDFR-AT-0126]